MIYLVNQRYINFHFSFNFYCPLYVPLNTYLCYIWHIFISELQQYIAAYGHAHPNLGLTDAQFTAVFHAIPLSYNQIDAASVIGSSLSSISCATLAAIADGCQEYNKADVLGQLLQKTAVSDKQNKVLVEKKLTQFQFMNLDSKFFQ
jgi:hypothetical protein